MSTGLTLYQILGITILHDGYEQLITEDQIKQAYRTQASKLHPDVTDGDSARFNELKHARDVLLNPETRKIYDETGEVRRAGPVMNRQRVLLMTLLQQVLKGIVDADHEGDLETLNVPERVLGTLEARVKEHETHIAKIEKRLRRARTLLDRLTTVPNDTLEEDENPLRAILETGLVEVGRELTQAEEARDVNDLAIAVWRCYAYRTDAEATADAMAEALGLRLGGPHVRGNVGGYRRLHSPPAPTGDDPSDV